MSDSQTKAVALSRCQMFIEAMCSQEIDNCFNGQSSLFQGSKLAASWWDDLKEGRSKVKLGTAFLLGDF
jgi:hypothetical protein